MTPHGMLSNSGATPSNSVHPPISRYRFEHADSEAVGGCPQLSSVAPMRDALRTNTSCDSAAIHQTAPVNSGLEADWWVSETHSRLTRDSPKVHFPRDSTDAQRVTLVPLSSEAEHSAQPHSTGLFARLLHFARPRPPTATIASCQEKALRPVGGAYSARPESPARPSRRCMTRHGPNLLPLRAGT